MKKLLIIYILFSSMSLFSQSYSKQTENLLDSVNRIENVFIKQRNTDIILTNRFVTDIEEVDQFTYYYSYTAACDYKYSKIYKEWKCTNRNYGYSFSTKINISNIARDRFLDDGVYCVYFITDMQFLALEYLVYFTVKDYNVISVTEKWSNEEQVIKEKQNAKK